MKSKKHAIKAAVATGMAMTIFLMPTGDARAITAMGHFDCGQWFKNPSAKPWLAGYMSGMNAAIGKNKADPLERLNSGDQMFLWMDNYCKANPLNSVGDGGNTLYRELSEGKKTP